MIPFDLKLAWWQARGQGKRLGLFVLCVAIGVGARVAVGSFNGQIDQAVAREARQLLMADIDVSSPYPLTARDLAAVRAILPPGSRTQAMMNFITMASNPQANRSRLIELRGVEDNFPFYGRLQFSQGDVTVLNRTVSVVYAAPELFAQLALKPGQFLRLGTRDFTVAGTLEQEPGGGASAFALGPRVLVGLSHIPETHLVTPASRVRYSLLVALRDSRLSEGIAKHLRQALTGTSSGTGAGKGANPNRLTIRSYKDIQQQISRFFDRLADYLRLVSLMALLLGGIGIASTIRGFLRENLESIAVLRTLGASAQRLQVVYLSQAVSMGLVGSLAGVALGMLAEKGIPILLAGILPVTLEASLDWGAMGWGMFLGIATTALFTLLPLMEIPAIKPLALWREQSIVRLRGKANGFMFLSSGLFFAGIAAVETRSLLIGPLFLAGLAVAAVLLMGWGRLVLTPLANFRARAASFGVRHGLANLDRPGYSLLPAVLALGLAVLLLGLFSVLQTSLVSDIQIEDQAHKVPALFMIDIQADQVDALKGYLKKQNVTQSNFQPMVKARYIALNGHPLQPPAANTREQEEDQAMRNREQNLSFRNALSPDETLLQGKWMDVTASGEHPEASVEARFLKRLGAKLGDSLTFDIQGVELSARVTSIRKVKWNSFQPNFFILITPQALAGAPQTWIGTLSGVNAAQRNRLQMGIVEGFPNITLIDIANASQRVLHVLDRIAWAITFMAVFSLAAGLVVLLGITASSTRERVRDAALLKVLGAGRLTLGISLLVEFAALGSVASFGGLALSIGVGWGLVHGVFETDLVIPWAYLAGLAVLATVLCSITGVLACWRVFAVKPLEVLREEGQV